MPNWVKKSNDIIGVAETIKRRNKYRAVNYKKGRLHQTKFGMWSLEEMERLLKYSRSDVELSKIMGRSVQSIQIKRCRIATQKYKAERINQL